MIPGTADGPVLKPDVAEIARALELFTNSVVEIRGLHCKPRDHTVSGYFDRVHRHAAAAAAVKLDASGIYITMNPVNPALLARAANRLVERPASTTADPDIVHRRWLLLDFDPKRVAGISSTDEEKKAACDRAEACREHIAEQGWVAPVFADSGNGFHLLYPMDLPNDDASRKLVERVLKVLALQFSDDKVEVDIKVGNAARITKLYGTVARKGDSTPERPHRLSRILEDPQLHPGEVVTRKQLEALAALLPEEPKPEHHRNGRQSTFDLEQWIREHTLPVRGPIPWNGGLKWLFERGTNCPFGGAHDAEAGFILRHASGAIAAGCLHNSCNGKAWPDLREVYESGYRDRKRDGKKQGTGAGKGKTEWHAAAVADVIQGHDHFAQDEGHKLYILKDGVYRPQGKERVCQLVKKIVPPDEWDTHLANETIEYIRVDSPHLWEQPPLDVININNGLLDLQTHQLLPHSPKHLSTVQLPVAYDPDAKCPAWEKQVLETFPDDAVKAGVAWQIVAWLMVRLMLQKALLLLGPGGTGKSTFLAALYVFLGGRRNVSGLSLHKIENDRFAASRLIGKLANICADLPSTHLENSSVFKNITGDDPSLPAEYKFKDSFDFKPFVRLIFSANQPPQSKDASGAFFDRWYVLSFDHVYRGTEQEVSRQELDAKLTTPSELSGLLNKALDVLPAVIENGLTVTASMEAAHEEFRKMTDPLSIWLNQKTIEDPKALIPRTELINAYNGAAMAEGRPGMTVTAFGLALKKLRPAVTDKQRTWNGKLNVWCYIGIGLEASKDQQTSAQSEEPEARLWSH